MLVWQEVGVAASEGRLNVQLVLFAVSFQYLRMVLDQLIFNLDDFEGWLPDGHQKFAHALTLVIGAQI